MVSETIGGGKSSATYLRLFVVGVLVGSLIRFVAFLTPSGTVRWLEDTLLPGESN